MKIHWAIQTKFPKDGGEHRVLASSAGGLNASEYDQLISKWLTGGMPQDATEYNPGAPWYQFGVDGEGHSLHQVVIKQEWSEYGDVLNRPVRITTCILIPFDDLAKSSCGFVQMAGLFEKNEVKNFLSERRGEIQVGKEKLDCELLEVSLSERGESLSWIESEKHDALYAFYQQAVHALLGGKLGLMTSGGDIPSEEERLQWLDRVLALLPYGVRAYCPASLWASGSSEHNMRLYWGRSARPGHGSLTIPPRATAELQQPLDEYLQDIRMLLERKNKTTLENEFTLERILTLLTELTTSQPLTGSLPRDILYSLGGDIIVLNRLRREKQKLSNETIEDAIGILTNNELNKLNEEERNEFIVTLLPYLKSEQVELISPYWNDELKHIVLESARDLFRQESTDKLDTLCIHALLLLQMGGAEELFSQLLEFCGTAGEKSRPTLRKMFIGLLHDTLYNGKQYKSGKKRFDQLLVLWAAKTLSEEFLYFWANWLSESSQSVQDEPLSLVLQEIESSRSLLFKALKIAWGIDSDKLDNIINLTNIPPTYCIVLIQVSAARSTLDKTFATLARKLLEQQNELEGMQTSSMMQSMLRNSLLSFPNLRGNECALLDEIRLLTKSDCLVSPEVLSIPSADFGEYLKEIKRFINDLSSERQSAICDYLYKYLWDKRHNMLLGQNVVPSNFEGFCKTMQEVNNSEVIRWKTIIGVSYDQLIFNAIQNRYSLDEIVHVCELRLSLYFSEKRTNEQEAEIWRSFVQTVSRYNFTNDAENMWLFTKSLGYYVTKKGGNGSSLEGQFHLAVINEEKFLYPGSQERKKYLDLVSRQTNSQMNLLYYLAPRLKNNKHWLDTFEQTISRLRKELFPWF